eukprot:TRINITY_DN2644_c0_g2_i3.p1 TRINITY_DN2644_c0_g2~~TRINITY_DN2644_c0_g2_i3.p1  ORF type:complete len:1597 (-),score=226.96 TRINITY_DN2644_c0_g2_i3:362-4915(-)
MRQQQALAQQQIQQQEQQQQQVEVQAQDEKPVSTEYPNQAQATSGIATGGAISSEARQEAQIASERIQRVLANALGPSYFSSEKPSHQRESATVRLDSLSVTQPQQPVIKASTQTQQVSSSVASTSTPDQPPALAPAPTPVPPPNSYAAALLRSKTAPQKPKPKPVARKVSSAVAESSGQNQISQISAAEDEWQDVVPKRQLQKERQKIKEKRQQPAPVAQQQPKQPTVQNKRMEEEILQMEKQLLELQAEREAMLRISQERQMAAKAQPGWVAVGQEHEFEQHKQEEEQEGATGISQDDYQPQQTQPVVSNAVLLPEDLSPEDFNSENYSSVRTVQPQMQRPLQQQQQHQQQQQQVHSVPTKPQQDVISTQIYQAWAQEHQQLFSQTSRNAQNLAVMSPKVAQQPQQNSSSYKPLGSSWLERVKKEPSQQRSVQRPPVRKAAIQGTQKRDTPIQKQDYANVSNWVGINIVNAAEQTAKENVYMQDVAELNLAPHVTTETFSQKMDQVQEEQLNIQEDVYNQQSIDIPLYEMEQIPPGDGTFEDLQVGNDQYPEIEYIEETDLQLEYHDYSLFSHQQGISPEQAFPNKVEFEVEDQVQISYPPEIIVEQLPEEDIQVIQEIEEQAGIDIIEVVEEYPTVEEATTSQNQERQEQVSRQLKEDLVMEIDQVVTSPQIRSVSQVDELANFCQKQLSQLTIMSVTDSSAPLIPDWQRESANNSSNQLGQSRNSSFFTNLIENDEDNAHYQDAVLHVLNAFEHTWHQRPLNSPRSRISHMLAMQLRFLFTWVVLILVFVTFFEEPLWCIRDDVNGGNRCKGNSSPDAMYPMMGLPLIHRWADFWVEIVGIFILSIEVILQITAYGTEGFLKIPVMSINGALIMIYALDVIYAYSTPYSWFRIAPYARIFLLINRSNDIRQQVRLLFRTLPSVLAFVFVVFLYLTVFAFVGTILLHTEDVKYFGDMGTSYWSLMVLLTTCNYPDVVITTFTQNRLTFVFFVIFCLFGVFFLANFVTAVVYNSYIEQDQEEQKAAFHFTENNLDTAFMLIDKDEKGYLTKEEFSTLMNQMKRYRQLSAFIHDGTASLVFAMLDDDGTEVLSRKNFVKLVTVLHVRFEKVEKDTFLERNFPTLFKSRIFQGFKRVVLSAWFEYAMMVVLIVMAVLTIVESASDLSGKVVKPSSENDRRVDSLWNFVELLFTLIFVFEAIVKILAMGWKHYWRECKFEFAVALLSVLVTIIVYLPNNINNSVLIRYTQMLRLLQLLKILQIIGAPGILRLMRLLTAVKTFKVFYGTFVRMLPAVTKLIKMIFCLMYIYSALGVQLYGGLINKDKAAPQYAILQQSDYGQAKYYPMNMNDLLGGFVVLFEMLMINNWQLFVDGFVAVSSNWTYAFFISFYFIGVVTGLNIFVAFVLDTFLRVYSTTEQELKVEGEAVIKNEEALFDAEFITGTATGIEGEYRATMRGFQDSETKAQLLAQMFEQQEDKIRQINQHLEFTLSGELPIPPSLSDIQEESTQSQVGPTSV